MPLLMCPNDESPMQTVERAGVQFDMCPSCRGVWLDRGELEKLMASSREAVPAEAPRQPYVQPQPQPAPYREEHRREEYRGDHRPDQYRGHDPKYDPRYGHKKKRGFDLFDIFD